MTEKIFSKPVLKSAARRSRQSVPVTDFSLSPHYQELGKGKKYTIQTYGCQGNEADSEKISGLLELIGFTKAPSEAEADLLVFNTCAIRANAENKVFGELGRVKQYKEQRPDLIIAVGGCMPQEEVVVEKILKTYHQVDIVFGTHNLHRLPDYLASVISGVPQVVDVWSEEGSIVEHLPTVRANGAKAWVNIMFGCDEFCTYCIVPYARGKERSRRPEDIIAEVTELASRGYREVTLLGQNVNSYGLDFVDRDYRFADLLAELRLLPIPRIRFTTSHPKDFSQSLIDVLSQGGNLMPSIHLPVQSGSDRILKAMNRKYTKDQYLDLVQRIRTAIPGVSLTTDLIVGFPGETEADFQETLELVERAEFEGAYTFVFSPRAGTPAASLPDATPKAEKMERLYRLNDRINAGFSRGNARFLGQTVEVLVDGASKTKSDILSGYTPHNKLVNFPGSPELIGTIVPVHLVRAKTWSLDGEVALER